MPFTLDDPALFDCSITPIPASTSPALTVIEAVPRVDFYGSFTLKITETIGKWAALYRGPVGQEEFLCAISGGGIYEKSAKILKNDRISIRSLEASPITTGKLFVEFFEKGRI